MARVFSVASWNVEHFRSAADSPASRARVKRVAGFLHGENGGPPRVPDLFALYEVEGKDVYHEFMERFPSYRFHLTEGKETQEIFIGVHRRLQTFSTQRLEFKTGREYQRPGLLLSLRAAGADYSPLFLHVRSGADTEDFGLRNAAIGHAFNLKKALDKATGGQANFIFLGDLNTMGVDDPVPYSRVLDFAPAEEIARIANWARKRDMALESKDTTLVDGTPEEVTWYNGSPNYRPTNLDHVVASEHMQIRSAGTGPAGVSLFGWPRLPSAQWNTWLKDYSDHALLYFEVWT